MTCHINLQMTVSNGPCRVTLPLAEVSASFHRCTALSVIGCTGVFESLLALAGLDFQLNFVFFLFLEICSYLIFSPLSLYGGGGLVTKSCLTFAISLTLACQAPLSMGFSRQGYWSGLPCPSPGDLPNPGIEPGSTAL